MNQQKGFNAQGQNWSRFDLACRGVKSIQDPILSLRSMLGNCHEVEIELMINVRTTIADAYPQAPICYSCECESVNLPQISH
jgi:hypothetical protein